MAKFSILFKKHPKLVVFPIVFEKCPHCRCKKTAAQEAIKPHQESGKVAKDSFASLEKVFVPLYEPALAVTGVPCLLAHFDICIECGQRRCTKLETTNASIQFQKMPQQTFMPPAHGKGGRG